MMANPVYQENADHVAHKVPKETLAHQVLMDVPVKMEQMAKTVKLVNQGERVMQETSEISELTV